MLDQLAYRWLHRIGRPGFVPVVLCLLTMAPAAFAAGRGVVPAMPEISAVPGPTANAMLGFGMLALYGFTTIIRRRNDAD